MLLLFFSFYLLANTESYQDMISKAERLTLQRDRQKALQILSLSFQKEGHGKKEKKEIAKTAKRISEVFLQDKSQRLYTKAEAQKTRDVNLALETLDEAFTLEPANMLLHLEKVRIQIAQKGCENEKKSIKEALSLTPLHPEMQTLYLQALVCLKEPLPDDFLYLPFSLQEEDFLYREALYYYLKGKFAVSLNSLDQALQKKTNLANYYWLKDKIYIAQELPIDKNRNLWRGICENKEKEVEEISLYYLNVCSTSRLPERSKK